MLTTFSLKSLKAKIFLYNRIDEDLSYIANMLEELWYTYNYTSNICVFIFIGFSRQSFVLCDFTLTLCKTSMYINITNSTLFQTQNNFVDSITFEKIINIISRLRTNPFILILLQLYIKDFSTCVLYICSCILSNYLLYIPSTAIFRTICIQEMWFVSHICQVGNYYTLFVHLKETSDTTIVPNYIQLGTEIHYYIHEFY